MRQLLRIVRSFRFAGAGVGYLLRTQPNFWVHCFAAALVVVLSLLLGISTVEVGVLVLAIGLVLACEAFNTSIEALVDLASPEYHPLAKVAKDTAAAGVLVGAIAAAAAGALILGRALLALFG